MIYVIDDRQLEVVLMIVSVGMTPPEAMLWSINLTAVFEVDMCRVSISPPFSEHSNCSDKS